MTQISQKLIFSQSRSSKCPYLAVVKQYYASELVTFQTMITLHHYCLFHAVAVSDLKLLSKSCSAYFDYTVTIR